VRRKEREEKEQRLAELRAGLQGKIDGAIKSVEQAEELTVKAEQLATPFPIKAKTMPAAEMVPLAEEADAAVKKAREEVAETRTVVVGLLDGVEQELKTWLTTEVRKLETRLQKCEQKLTKAASWTTRFREDARRKESEELLALEKEVLRLIKYHQGEAKSNNDELFLAFDTNSDGSVDEAEFLQFFKVCKRGPAPKVPHESEAQDKGGTKDDTRMDADGVELKPSPSELSRVFKYWDDDEHEGRIPKDKFLNLIRKFMKVTKVTVITNGPSIKYSQTIRRLEVGEVIEILEGPVCDTDVDVMRVRAKVMRDDIEGWVSTGGNQGTTFLEEGGNLFRVVRETILTESFELDGNASKETTRKLKDTTRKLKEGEIVEVREWARKESKSGLMRMKCKCKDDGVTGWVTTVGNQGTVFLEVI